MKSNKIDSQTCSSTVKYFKTQHAGEAESNLRKYYDIRFEA